MTPAPLHDRVLRLAQKAGPQSIFSRIKPAPRDSILYRLQKAHFGTLRTPSNVEIEQADGSELERRLLEIQKLTPGDFFRDNEMPRSKDAIRRMTADQKLDYANGYRSSR